MVLSATGVKQQGERSKTYPHRHCACNARQRPCRAWGLCAFPFSGGVRWGSLRKAAPFRRSERFCRFRVAAQDGNGSTKADTRIACEKISFFFDRRPLLMSFAGNARVRPAETVTFRACRKAQRVVWNGRKEYYYWYGAPQRADAGKPAKFEKRRCLQNKCVKLKQNY